jgi:hypothetical protein
MKWLCSGVVAGLSITRRKRPSRYMYIPHYWDEMVGTFQDDTNNDGTFFLKRIYRENTTLVDISICRLRLKMIKFCYTCRFVSISVTLVPSFHSFSTL